MPYYPPPISDSDKGDVIVSANGATWTIDPNVATAAGRALIDDADAAAQRATLDVLQASTRLGKLVFGGTSYLGAPGVIFGSQNTATLSANEVRYFPFYVYSPVTALLIQLEIQTVAASGKLCRMGICTATFSTFLPLASLVDAGSVAADTLGVKAVAINQALAIGPYFLMINSDGTPIVRTVRGQLEGAFLLPTMGSAALAGSLRAAQTYGAFPGTPTAPTSVSGTSGGWDYAVELQW